MLELALTFGATHLAPRIGASFTRLAWHFSTISHLSDSGVTYVVAAAAAFLIRGENGRSPVSLRLPGMPWRVWLKETRFCHEFPPTKSALSPARARSRRCASATASAACKRAFRCSTCSSKPFRRGSRAARWRFYLGRPKRPLKLETLLGESPGQRLAFVDLDLRALQQHRVLPRSYANSGRSSAAQPQLVGHGNSPIEGNKGYSLT